MGYDHTPLEREKVLEFIARLEELQRKQKMEFDKHQVHLVPLQLLSPAIDLYTLFRMIATLKTMNSTGRSLSCVLKARIYDFKSQRFVVRLCAELIELPALFSQLSHCSILDRAKLPTPNSS